MTKYRDAGVDIDTGNEFVKRIRPLAKATLRPEVLAGIGGFGALFKIDLKKYKEPVLVSGTDGVGTKVLIAQALEQWDTVGIDLVAMSVNDILTHGAEPLFFLDYLAVGKLELPQATQLVKGIADGCKEAGCALIGGETAEMPGVYEAGEFDLAGFAVGMVDKNKIIDGSSIAEGDILLGLPSSGLHSNGYSLARKVLLGSSEKPTREMRSRLLEKIPELDMLALGEVLLRPTRIYVQPVLKLNQEVALRGIAHITGGGFIDNLPRIFSEDLSAHVHKSSWEVPPIFGLIGRQGQVSEEELYRTFNMGIGMVLFVATAEVDRSIEKLRKSGIEARIIGEMRKRKRGGCQVELED